ncbi:60S ribosomal protein, partial [Aspergillus ochraceoroseus]
MVRYAAQDISAAKSARARGSYLRVSFKNTRETAQAINGMKLQRALTFLDNVTNKAEASHSAGSLAAPVAALR